MNRYVMFPSNQVLFIGIKVCFLLTAFCCLNLLFSSPFRANAAELRTEEGEEVGFPYDMPIISAENPGIWARQAKSHTPQINSHMRYMGLEASRVLEIFIPPLEEAGTEDTLKAIYLLDKDDLLIAYWESPQRGQKVKLNISGDINYLKVYIHCSHSSLWEKVLRF